MLTTFDAVALVDIIANKLNNINSSADLDRCSRMLNDPAVRSLVEEMGVENFCETLGIARGLRISESGRVTETDYSFSELGIATVENLIETMNVIRFHLEGCDKPEDLSESARVMLERYTRTYELAPNSALTEREYNKLVRGQALCLFASKDFKLSDSIYNQRYLNTLGRNMLSAVMVLHTKVHGNLSHRDIKPDNIMVFQEVENRTLTVKLIDLDLIERNGATRKLRDIGCQPFMPPEAMVPEKDGSISYDGQKADAYALGFTLRLTTGFGMKEILELSNLHKAISLKKTLGAIKDKDAYENELLSEAEQTIRNTNLRPDNEVEDQLRIMSIMDSVPRAISLKNVSDLLLKIDPGKRLCPEKILSLKFFSEKQNFLSDQEFSDHSKLLVRFSATLEAAEVKFINDLTEAPTENLAQVRQVANREALANRGVHSRASVSTSNGSTTLGAGERLQAGLHEIAPQVRAHLRRGGRMFASLFSEKKNIADMKHDYADRF